MGHLIPYDFSLAVMRGQVPGYGGINKFGQAADVDTSLTDLWDGADGVTSTKIWVAPTTARIHSLVSAHADDDNPAGAGMRTVRVYGLQTWDSVETSEVVAMNGVASVPTINAYVIIHRMQGVTYGANATNTGVIKATAATDATVTAAILAGNGQTLMAIYGVSSKQQLFVKALSGSVLRTGGAASVDYGLWAQERADQSDTGFNIKERFQVTDTSPHKEHFTVPKTYDGPCIVKLQAISSRINTQVTGGFDAFVAHKVGETT